MRPLLAPIVILVFCLLLLDACTAHRDSRGGTLPARTQAHLMTHLNTTGGVQVEYYEMGHPIEVSVPQDFTHSLDWIRNNTTSDAHVLAWWDFGRMIRAYAGRETTVISPSADILDSVGRVLAGGMWNETRDGRLSTPQSVRDVASALMTDKPETTLAIMRQYHADYLFVARAPVYSLTLAPVFAKAAFGGSYSDYSTDDYNSPDPVRTPLHKLSASTLYNAVEGMQIPGLKLVYSDQFVNIYQVKKR